MIDTTYESGKTVTVITERDIDGRTCGTPIWWRGKRYYYAETGDYSKLTYIAIDGDVLIITK